MSKTIPFPAPSDPTTPPNRTAGPALVENIVAKKLTDIQLREELTAIESGILVPDEDRIAAICLSAAAEMRALYWPAFDPENSEEDRLIKVQLDIGKETLKRFENEKVQKQSISDKAADAVPAIPTSPPQVSVPVVLCSVLAFALEVGASLHPLLSQAVDDGPTALGAAGLMGIVVGVVLVYGSIGIGGND